MDRILKTLAYQEYLRWIGKTDALAGRVSAEGLLRAVGNPAAEAYRLGYLEGLNDCIKLAKIGGSDGMVS